MNICKKICVCTLLGQDAVRAGLVFSTVLVVSQVEVVLHGVAHHKDTEGQMPQWLSGGVLAVEVFGLVSADDTAGLWSGG